MWLAKSSLFFLPILLLLEEKKKELKEEGWSVVLILSFFFSFNVHFFFFPLAPLLVLLSFVCSCLLHWRVTRSAENSFPFSVLIIVTCCCRLEQLCGCSLARDVSSDASFFFLCLSLRFFFFCSFVSVFFDLSILCGPFPASVSMLATQQAHSSLSLTKKKTCSYYNTWRVEACIKTSKPAKRTLTTRSNVCIREILLCSIWITAKWPSFVDVYLALGE